MPSSTSLPGQIDDYDDDKSLIPQDLRQSKTTL